MSGTQRKGGRTVQAKAAAGVARALGGRSRELSSEEEKVVRTRHGATLDPHAPLARKASGEVLDELMLIELELRRRYRAHLAGAAGSDDRKQRIVNALRRKH